jgi:hypothetical protein
MKRNFAMRNGMRIVVCRPEWPEEAVRRGYLATKVEDLDAIYEICGPWRKIGYLASNNLDVLDDDGNVCGTPQPGDSLVNPHAVTPSSELN